MHKILIFKDGFIPSKPWRAHLYIVDEKWPFYFSSYKSKQALIEAAIERFGDDIEIVRAKELDV